MSHVDEENRDEWAGRETVTLDKLEAELWSDINGLSLTTAQRLTALSEIRKVVHLRSLINELIVPRETEA